MKALIFFLVIPFVIVSGAENNGRGTKAIAFANAFVAVADNSWAVSYNAAGLAQIHSPQVTAFYIPQQFGIPELRTTSLAAAFTVDPGTLGAFIEQFGFDLFRSTEIGLGYGIRVDQFVSAGLSIDLQHFAIERYGSTSNLTLDFGLLGRISSDLAIGFSMKNLTASTIGAHRERLPQYFLLGLCYSPVKDFLIVTELEKDVQFPLVVKAGIEEKLLGFLSLRCGIANNPDKFSAGVAVQYSGVEFGYAGYSHLDLGWTHQIEVTLQWGDSE